jgi:hypothetical protein
VKGTARSAAFEPYYLGLLSTAVKMLESVWLRMKIVSCWSLRLRLSSDFQDQTGHLQRWLPPLGLYSQKEAVAYRASQIEHL